DGEYSVAARTVPGRPEPSGPSTARSPGNSAPSGTAAAEEATSGSAGTEAVTEAVTGSYALPWLMADLPDEQRLGTWWPAPGTTLISGGPSSGRTSALQSLAESALRAGTPVHVLAEGAEEWPGADAPAAGTWCGTDDPR